MIGLDVHIAVSADTPPAWVSQCFRSVHAAASAAGYPVVVHCIEGVPGHIGRARAAGFECGEHAHCTFVDDDDYVAPEAFAALAPALHLNPRLAFTSEVLLQNDRTAGIARMHHLALVRREDATAHDWHAYPTGGEAELYAGLGEPLLIDAPVYFHRLYRSKGRALRGGLRHG